MANFRVTCYPRDHDRHANHEGWHHVDSWRAVEAALDAGIDVCDSDGDKIDLLDNDYTEGGTGTVHEGSQTFDFPVTQILVRELPVSQEDEQAALASIADAFKNLQD
jgi:hypothetical protein